MAKIADRVSSADLSSYNYLEPFDDTSHTSHTSHTLCLKPASPQVYTKSFEPDLFDFDDLDPGMDEPVELSASSHVHTVPHNLCEDWEDDFEFDDPISHDEAGPVDGTIPGWRSGVLVPESIISSQGNVKGAFSMVQDFARMIKLMTGLLDQATSLGIRHGGEKQLWDEAEELIALATINEDEDEEMIAAACSPGRSSWDMQNTSDLKKNGLTSSPGGWRARRKSIPFPDENKVSRDEPSSEKLDYVFVDELPESAFMDSPNLGDEQSQPASAETVLQILHEKRPQMEWSGRRPSPSNGKVSFDTNTLKQMVSYVSLLSHKLSNVLKLAPEAPDTPQPIQVSAEHSLAEPNSDLADQNEGKDPSRTVIHDESDSWPAFKMETEHSLAKPNSDLADQNEGKGPSRTVIHDESDSWPAFNMEMKSSTFTEGPLKTELEKPA